jgi:hypothetical protein
VQPFAFEKFGVSTRGRKTAWLKAACTGSGPAHSPALRRLPLLAAITLATVLLNPLIGVAEISPDVAADVAPPNERPLTLASVRSTNGMTLEVESWQHWPPWSSERLSYRPDPVDCLSRCELNDRTLFLMPERFLNQDGEVTWSTFQAGYGLPFSRDSLLSKSRNDANREAKSSLVYVKFSHDF